MGPASSHCVRGALSLAEGVSVVFVGMAQQLTGGEMALASLGMSLMPSCCVRPVKQSHGQATPKIPRHSGCANHIPSSSRWAPTVSQLPTPLSLIYAQNAVKPHVCPGSAASMSVSFPELPELDSASVLHI